MTRHAPLHLEKPDVIVVGESLMDIVVQTQGSSIEHPGGSPANVAYGLARLGIPTGFLTSIGKDDRGAALVAHLSGAGVQILAGSQSSASTSTATAFLADDGSATYEFDIAWDLGTVAPTYVPRILHTGSIASFLEPGSRRVHDLLESVAGLCTITYDPNIRPQLLGSHHQAKTVFEDLIPLLNVVKLGDEDAAWLYPGLSPEETARRVRGLGADLTVVTMGSRGSLILSHAAEILVPAVQASVADTIGAGDSYMAALIVGLHTAGGHDLSPSSLERVARVASAAAAITVSRSGAHLPNAEELQALLAARPVITGNMAAPAHSIHTDEGLSSTLNGPGVLSREP